MLEFKKSNYFFYKYFFIIDGATFSALVRFGTNKMAAIKNEIVPNIYIGQTEGHVFPDYRVF